MTDLASLMADEPDPKTLNAAIIRSYEAKVQALLARVAELEKTLKQIDCGGKDCIDPSHWLARTALEGRTEQLKK